ncbi:MAG: hypothetical protein IJ682_13915 [Lachnospiraceae bacterium]|nr:hypothetical protein [Lachnospiraceae bacterium]
MKLDIRRRMRLIALSGGVLFFVGLLLIVCVGIYLAGEKVTERRHILSDSVSGMPPVRDKRQRIKDASEIQQKNFVHQGFAGQVRRRSRYLYK